MATVLSTPAATASIPSAVSQSPSKKRAAESPASPSMTLAAAKKTLSSLKLPSKGKGATQSEYVRFKSLLLKDAKARGDKDTTDNITKIAKEAWKKVQYQTPPSADELDTKTDETSSSGDDIQRYLRLKGVMLKEEREMQAKFDAEAKAYCTAFVTSASSYLQWCLIEATEEHQQTLVEAMKLVKGKYVPSYFRVYRVDDTPALNALRETLEQAKEFKKLKDERVLLSKLQNATEEGLKLHVKEHIRLLAQAAELDKLKKNKAVEDEKKREADERELAKADDIQDEITRALKKQMKYGSLNNKHSSTRISYTKGGVSHKVFAKAFGVPVGTKQATIDGAEVGETYLRYGASLKCTEVKVKLVGDELVAQTSFFMDK